MIFRRSVGVVALLTLVVTTAGFSSSPLPMDAELPLATVTVYGRAGSFGSLGSVGDFLPSGQQVAKAAVPGWVFPAGRMPHRVVKAGDTLLMPGRDVSNPVLPSAGDFVVSAFELSSKRLSTIRIPTTTGKLVVERDDHHIAPSISDILPLADDLALYTASPTLIDQNLSRDGLWPVLGLLTKVDGRWRPGKSWTGAKLRFSGGEAAEKACPPAKIAVESDCRALGRMARLPSGDIVVTQEGGLVVLSVTRDGAVQIKQQYDFPAGVGRPSEISVHPADNQFVVSLGLFGPTPMVQEFFWDKEKLAPKSGLLLTGEAKTGYAIGAYDNFGNLWVSRREGDAGGGSLGVFRRARCAVATAPVVCRPDFDVIQPSDFPAPEGLLLDPATNTMIYLAKFGVLQAIRFDGKDFTISNPVDLGSRQLGASVKAFVEHQLGVVDGSRLWLPAMQQQAGVPAGARFDHWLYSIDLDDLFAPAPTVLEINPGWPATVQVERAVDTGTTLQQTSSGVINVLSNVAYGVCGDFPAWISCATDDVPGNGFFIKDPNSMYGILRGSIGYQIRVLEPGSYRVWLHAFTWPSVKRDVVVELSVDDQTLQVQVPRDMKWHHLSASATITLSAGVHTVTIKPAEAYDGWYLNSFTLRRI